MARPDRSDPPAVWCDWWTEVHQLTPDIAYGWVPEHLRADTGDPNPWFWHWCSAQGRWMAQAAPDHTLVSTQPLHLEPSLLWPCCGVHGFVRGGEWIPA
ncbi:hypothetical protein ACF1BS_04080 [Streptomyces sp. NPDC014748]|uniref:hypothetical protein n=1 Tax=Streptomyces sp. NPDC014748 TaxID=3364905 RepID=UPI0036FCE9C5